MIFKNLKPHITKAIKESCRTIDVRLNNLANEVQHIPTDTVEPGVEIVKGLSKIIDRTIKDAVSLGCNLSVIINGIMVGAFRSSPFMRQEAHKTIRLLIEETLHATFKYNGDVILAIEGILASVVILAKEYKLNVMEALKIAKEDILASCKKLNIKFPDEVKKKLSDPDESS